MPFYNEVLFVGFLLFDMAMVVLMYRWFGKEGLFAYSVLAIIACNIQVVKLVQVFGMDLTLGNVLYGSIFLTTDIISEVHGRREARKAIWLGFAALLLMTLYMKYAIWVRPSPFDAAQPHLEGLFNVLPRIGIASLLAYLCSQMHDVWAFHWIRARTGKPMLWLRNNAATILSQAIDTTVFTLLAFLPLHGLANHPLFGSIAVIPGFESMDLIMKVWWTTFVLKLIVAVGDTPFVYWGRAVGHKKYGTDEGRPSGGQTAAQLAEPAPNG